MHGVCVMEAVRCVVLSRQRSLKHLLCHCLNILSLVGLRKYTLHYNIILCDIRTYVHCILYASILPIVPSLPVQCMY